MSETVPQHSKQLQENRIQTSPKVANFSFAAGSIGERVKDMHF